MRISALKKDFFSAILPVKWQALFPAGGGGGPAMDKLDNAD